MKAYWFLEDTWTPKHGNIGDIVNPMILEYVTGQKAELSEGDGRVLACGSIVSHMHDDDILWGCGIIKPMALPKCQGVKIPMVRGHYTKFGLKLSGYDVESTIFGDPCQLLPEMMPRKRTDDYMIGVVSHYIEESESRATFKGDEFHHINIISDVDTFVSEINKCAVVISSSLHGIIISEAYDIPTHFYQLTDKVIGGEFKFQDYYWGQNRHFVNLRKYDPMSVYSNAICMIPPTFIDNQTIKQSLISAL